MSREILFRGWCARNEKWIEGDVICGNSGILIQRRSDAMCFPVNSDTVCQYTGLQDKNSTKIFDGDILEINGEDEFSEVIWDDCNAMFELKSGDCICNFDNYWSYECTVIGNVFDNPEILKGASQYANQEEGEENLKCRKVR